jgi:hypothetical protein
VTASSSTACREVLILITTKTSLDVDYNTST